MGFGYSVHLVLVIVLHQSLKINSFGVELPGSCPETNKIVKPDPSVTLESVSKLSIEKLILDTNDWLHVPRAKCVRKQNYNMLVAY